MIAPVANILSFHLAVKPPGEEVIHHTALRKAVDADMIALLEFVPERSCPLAPVSARESEELARQEVARMGRHDVEEARFFFGVAESLQRIEMGGGNVHSARILPVMS